jgi:hypothetical protein
MSIRLVHELDGKNGAEYSARTVSNAAPSHVLNVHVEAVPTVKSYAS